MKSFLITFFSILSLSILAQKVEKDAYLSNKTYTYEETNKIYSALAEKYEKASFRAIGKSDVGKPIYLFTISNDSNFYTSSIRNKNQTVLLINNAIHAGEPCGVDASVKFATDLLGSETYTKLLENTTICIIPFYNIGGGLNRSCCNRAGQNGPEEYGFRGNIQNRDLNRDFIKLDTENTVTFTKIYHQVNPDIFIDTHTTNGSDFQYTMSLIATQPNKLNQHLRAHLKGEMLPFLYDDMKQKGKEIIPYVYNVGKTPESGIKDYLETPRYSTGYTTLFNTIGFVTEALKYKPYQDRVEHTYEFLLTSLKWMSENNTSIKATRKMAIEMVKTQKQFEISWKQDTSSFVQIDFKGYETELEPSPFGKDAKRLVYNSKKPYTKKINYYNKFVPDVVIDKPQAYIIPQAYTDVIDRLQWNQIEMTRLKKDTVINVEMYYIKDYKTVQRPYEGHYLHHTVAVEKKKMTIQFYEGDFLVNVNQSGNRYIVETLEPQGMDSFFAWNFFDGILQQKEWYSAFSFEKIAEQLLKEDKALKIQFEQKKSLDVKFAEDRNQQLYFIYKNSPYYENTHNRYPVARLID